jgi:hypothetical protein
MRWLTAILAVWMCLAGAAVGQTGTGSQAACTALTGARVISEDGKFLGNISSPFDSDSIFNNFGKGSRFAAESIWNQFGEYGSKFAANSAMDPFSSTPPMIIKDGQVIGHLTKNKYAPGAIDPVVLGAVCFDYTPND